LGSPTKIVGIEITQNPNTISIAQKQYILSILQSNPEGAVGDRSNSFAMLIGKLQYLATATRPDIAFAVNRLAAYTANPSLTHYRNTLDSNIFYGYSDAAYANADDLKSTSGYVFLAGGAAITWGSRKQTTIALSSTEAEYIALSYYLVTTMAQ
jgi:hypothetical protein